LLVGLIPSLSGLSRQERERMITQGSVIEVEAGTRLVQAGEVGDQAFFVLKGKAVAGIAEEGGRYHALSGMEPGDYFGEIAALTGAPRTADVVTEEPTQLLQVSAELLRLLMAQPAFSKLVLARMSERLARTSIHDLPRTVGVSLADARALQREPVAGKQLELALG